MFTSFGYFEDKDNFMVLQETYRVLDHGGILILDLPNYNRIFSNFSCTREMPLRNEDTLKYRKRREGKYLIEERSRIRGNGQEENLLPIKLRIYPSEEIVRLCRKAGFNEVKTADQELKEFYPDNSKRLWVISAK